MMPWRYIQLGGKDLHYILKLPTEIDLIPHRMEEIDILKIIRDPIKLNILVSLDVLFLVGLENSHHDHYLCWIILCINCVTIIYVLVNYLSFSQYNILNYIHWKYILLFCPHKPYNAFIWYIWKHIFKLEKTHNFRAGHKPWTSEQFTSIIILSLHIFSYSSIKSW